MRSILLFIASLAIFTVACQSKKSDKKEAMLPMGVSKIVVKETFNAGGYSYINGENNVWLAVGQRPIEVGKSYYYKDALEMRNFHSKELNRDFPLIYFLNTISETPIEKKQMTQAPKMKINPVRKLEVSIKSEAGVTSVADLYSKKEEFSGKTITVQGKVAKFNKNIMGKNWIHLQDGSEFEGDYDLTITSSEITTVGEIIKISGTIVLDKDFGAGYSYSVLLENAKIVE